MERDGLTVRNLLIKCNYNKKKSWNRFSTCMHFYFPGEGIPYFEECRNLGVDTKKNMKRGARPVNFATQTGHKCLKDIEFIILRHLKNVFSTFFLFFICVNGAQRSIWYLPRGEKYYKRTRLNYRFEKKSRIIKS